VGISMARTCWLVSLRPAEHATGPGKRNKLVFLPPPRGQTDSQHFPGTTPAGGHWRRGSPVV